MGGFLRSVSSHRIWEPPQISFFSYYGDLLKLCLFFFMLYGDPLDHFFAYYIGAPRSLSLLTIWGPSDHFLLIQYAWGPLSDQFRCLLYGAPLRSISLHAIEGGGGDTSDFSFFTKYMEAPSDQFLRLLYGAPRASFFAYYMGPLRSVFVHTFWGPLSARSFFSLTIWGPLRSVSSHTIWGPRSDQFLRLLYAWGPSEISLFAYYMRAPLRSVSSLTIWGLH